MTSGGLAAVSSSFFAALYSAFGKYDVVHIHAEGPAFFCWLPKLFGKRVVVTIHGIDWQREKWQSGLGSKFIHQGEKNAVKYADEVIVLSKGVQDYFKETYDRETHFIPNGVNRPQIREAKLITDHFGLEKDSYILFLGRLVPEKGIRYLVEAFKNVKTDKKLVIAGGSSDTDSFMEELKELAKGDDRILFTGFVQGAMLDELYSNAYIYTLPSDLEGMPLSLLEAMSYGNCCLVSDIPECAEVVEDKLLLKPCDEIEITGYRWGRTKDGKRYPSQRTGELFVLTLCEIMDWNPDYRYKVLGKMVQANGKALIAFDLTSSECFPKVVNRDGKKVSSRQSVFAEQWSGKFGPTYSESRRSLAVKTFDNYTVITVNGKKTEVHPQAQPQQQGSMGDSL